MKILVTLIFFLLVFFPIRGFSQPRVYYNINVVCHNDNSSLETLSHDERFSNKINFQKFDTQYRQPKNKVSCQKVCLLLKPRDDNYPINHRTMKRTMYAERHRAFNNPDNEQALDWHRASNLGHPDSSRSTNNGYSHFCWDQGWPDNFWIVNGKDPGLEPVTQFNRTIFKFTDNLGYGHTITVTPRS